jgi:hypothetical protein
MNSTPGAVTSQPRPWSEHGAVRVDRVKIPISVLVISIIEIALGLLAIGLVLESQANGFNQAPLYLSIYSYASAIFLATALGLLVAALLSSPATRLLRLGRATIFVAAAAFVMTAGYSILDQVVAWTTPFMCDGCPLPQPPTVNQVVASVVLDVGGGALAALLPCIVLVVLRYRREALQVAPIDAPQIPPSRPNPAPSGGADQA